MFILFLKYPVLHRKRFGRIVCKYLINTLPNNRILDQSKLKAFYQENLKEVQMIKFVLDTVEFTVGKGGTAVCQHFLLFTQCLQGGAFKGWLKNQDSLIKG